MNCYSGKMRKTVALIALILCFLFLSQVTQVFAIEENNSRNIEKVEFKDGMKIIYYSDGTREFFVVCSTVIKAQTSVSSVVSHTVYYRPPNWPSVIERIMKIIKQIIETLNGISTGCFLLAWRIWNIIKGLRKGRPRDYYGVGIK